MDNTKTQAILGTRHTGKKNKTKNGQPRDTAILGTRHRTKNNKTKNETQATIHRHKDKEEDK